MLRSYSGFRLSSLSESTPRFLKHGSGTMTLTPERWPVLIPTLPLDYEQIGACLNEIDCALFRVADHHDCKRFNVDSQLTAVVLLLLRCCSLLRSLLILFQSGETDGFQVVLRAFEEAWYLAFYLRFGDKRPTASKWLAEKRWLVVCSAWRTNCLCQRAGSSRSNHGA